MTIDSMSASRHKLSPAFYLSLVDIMSWAVGHVKCCCKYAPCRSFSKHPILDLSIMGFFPCCFTIANPLMKQNMLKLHVLVGPHLNPSRDLSPAQSVVCSRNRKEKEMYPHFRSKVFGAPVVSLKKGFKCLFS